jgi:hypothetical protein
MANPSAFIKNPMEEGKEVAIAHLELLFYLSSFSGVPMIVKLHKQRSSLEHYCSEAKQQYLNKLDCC